MTSYVIERRDAMQMNWTKLGVTKDTTYNVGDLTEGNSYFFRVCAVNVVGAGPANELREPLVAKNPIGGWCCW